MSPVSVILNEKFTRESDIPTLDDRSVPISLLLSSYNYEVSGVLSKADSNKCRLIYAVQSMDLP